MKIKVCGMRDAANIRAVEQLGVDLIGLIFYPKSPRFVSDVTVLPAEKKADRVGVFVNATVDNVLEKIPACQLDCVQLHGKESAEQVAELRKRLDAEGLNGVQVIKAISVSSADDIALASEYAGVADFLLFDTKCEGMGGSGRKFAWEVLDAYQGQTRFLLSGGISPDDAEQVRSFSHPMMAGIDLNSRFELSPGMKNVHALAAFLQGIRQG